MNIKRKIARILRKDREYWRNVKGYEVIRVAETDTYTYASTIWKENQGACFLDTTLAWFNTAKEAEMFIVRHLGLSA